MEEARSRVELAIIQSDHRAHAATCVASEGNRMTSPRPSWRAAAAPRSPRRSGLPSRSLSAHHRFLLSQRLVLVELHPGAARSWNGRQLMSAPTKRPRKCRYFSQSNPDCLGIPENRPRFVLTNRSGATRSADDGVVVTGPRDDARMKLCGAGFVFSRSGDLCLFSGFRCDQSRVGGRCGGSVAA